MENVPQRLAREYRAWLSRQTFVTEEITHKASNLYGDLKNLAEFHKENGYPFAALLTVTIKNVRELREMLAR
jgi:hypothetical protein